MTFLPLSSIPYKVHCLSMNVVKFAYDESLTRVNFEVSNGATFLLYLPCSPSKMELQIDFYFGHNAWTIRLAR